MATPLAQQASKTFFSTLGGKPVHHTLANYWARLVELLYAAERMKELAADPALTDDKIRILPVEKPKEGIGTVEAPRGTIIHHYQTDENGLIENESHRCHTEQCRANRHERAKGRQEADLRGKCS
jgi:F420-non-reducing hydrogenase large subunit